MAMAIKLTRMEQKKTLFMMKTASGNVKQSINKYIEICQTDTVSGIAQNIALDLTFKFNPRCLVIRDLFLFSIQKNSNLIVGGFTKRPTWCGEAFYDQFSHMRFTILA